MRLTGGRPPPQLPALVRSWAPGLMWLVGLFERWPRLDARAVAGWRFLVLEEGGAPVAAACGEPRGTGWWSVIAPTPARALELVSRCPELAQARRLSLRADIADAWASADPSLAARIIRRQPVVAMVRDHRRGAPRLPMAGVGLAAVEDLPTLCAFPIVVEDQPIEEARAVLRARIGRGEVFVCRQGGRVVAMAEALSAGPYLDIQRVYTAPEARRRGHARAVMATIVAHGARQGRGACLCVDEENRAAQALYRELGFEPWWNRLDLQLEAPRLRRTRP